MSKENTPTYPSVVPGLNSNITVNDLCFHVQTEDLGSHNSAIVTHVFSRSGQVVKVVRYDYAKHRDKPNLRNLLGQALQLQHAVAIRELKQGEGSVQTLPGLVDNFPMVVKNAQKAGLCSRWSSSLARAIRFLLNTCGPNSSRH